MRHDFQIAEKSNFCLKLLHSKYQPQLNARVSDTHDVCMEGVIPILDISETDSKCTDLHSGYFFI